MLKYSFMFYVGNDPYPYEIRTDNEIVGVDTYNNLSSNGKYNITWVSAALKSALDRMEGE